MRSRFLSAFAFLAVIAGCDSGDPVTPQLDLNAALSTMTAGAAAYADLGMAASLPAPSTNASDCAFDAPSGFFVCPAVTSNGITFTRKFQLRDASGSPLSSIDPLLVASIRAVSDVNGTVVNTTTAPIAFQVTRHDDATLAGVQSSNRILDGIVTQQMIATSGSDVVTVNDTTVTTQLQLPSTPQQKYPLGGKVVSSGAIHNDPSPVEKYRIEIAFDGSSFVTVTATVGGQTWTCKTNMASPSSSPSCS